MYSWSRRNRTGRGHLGATPLPILSWSGHRDYADIPAPDFSYWGHEMDSGERPACLVHHGAAGRGTDSARRQGLGVGKDAAVAR